MDNQDRARQSGGPAGNPGIVRRKALAQNLAGPAVDSAAFHTARLDIQTDVGTLIPGRNLQTFKCGSTGPTSGP
ncbi:MAG: hypothetical protein QOH19_2063 [Actinomycetota bacterium]|jgi:hypothetical protein|nr:hypothetical protein [Actinomycetota bacterium]